MSLEPPELVARRRALGHQLAAMCQAVGIGQQQVARRTGYSRSSITHAEAGRQLLTRDFWKTADELVKADGALLAGYEQVQATKQEHERQSREAELAAARARAEALRATTASQLSCACGTGRPAVPVTPVTPVTPVAQAILASLATAADGELTEGLARSLAYLAFLSSAAQVMPVESEDQVYLDEQLAKFLRGWADRMNRRQLLQLLGWAATVIAAAPDVPALDAAEQERLSRAIISPSRVDAQVIDHIETMLHHCKRQEDALGPQAVLHTVLVQRQLVHTLLTECPAALRPRLLSVYSSMSSSAGFYFFDLDDPASAMRCCDQARAAAQKARNTELAIYALCNMSYFASWQGKAHAALDFAAAAQSLTDKSGDELLRVCVAERTGTAYAVDGQYMECMTEFDRALSGLTSSAGQESPASPAYWYHDGLIASQQSDCLLRLGKPQEAAASASAGLQLFDDSFVGSLAFCTLRLGTARLQSGEVEDAARIIGDGALLATQNRSVRLTSEVKAARGRMQPWEDTAAVKALDERLVDLDLGA